MTRERIADGLELLLLQLANGETTAAPDGWLPHEWIYIKGIASSAIWQVRSRFVIAGQV
jgi:hypothetical protein